MKKSLVYTKTGDKGDKKRYGKRTADEPFAAR